MVARFRLIKAGPELPPGEFLSRDGTVAACVVGIRYTVIVCKLCNLFSQLDYIKQI